jgi:hypothetical protein
MHHGDTENAETPETSGAGPSVASGVSGVNKG